MEHWTVLPFCYEWPLDVLRRYAGADMSACLPEEVGHWLYRQHDFLFETQKRLDCEDYACPRQEIEHLFQRLVKQFDDVRLLALKSGIPLSEEWQHEISVEQWRERMRAGAMQLELVMLRLAGTTAH